MRTMSDDELQQNFEALLDSVTDDHLPLIVTRSKGRPAAILMSLEDYAAIEETHHLLRSPRNAERLITAIEQLDRGEGTDRQLIK